MTDRQGCTDGYARTLIPADGLVAAYGGALVQAFVPALERSPLMERLAELPRLQISDGELLDLEMIACGALSPLTGFMTQDAYRTVLREARLPDGRPWGLPVTIAVSRETALSVRSGQEVALCRGDEAVGLLRIDELYPWDAESEAHALGQGLDGARLESLRARSAVYLVGGPATLLASRGAGFMQRRHLWPLELRAQFAQRGWRHVAVPHLRFPWQRTHEYLLKCALETSDALLVHAPVEPEGTKAALPSELLAMASRMLLENYFPVDRVTENPLASAYLGSSARAALMHAIVSQNYGASQLFIPSTPGNDAAGELLAAAERHGLAVRAVHVPATFHCEPCGGIASPKSCPHDLDRRFEVREDEVIEQLRTGEPLSPLVARPDIARALARAVADRMECGAVAGPARHIHPHASEVSRALRESLAGHKACALWMTGLSGSGKSTIAHRLERELLLAGHRVFVLDGDTLRHGLNRDLGFSEADRRENLRRAAEVVKVMVEAGLIVIASFISPFRAERAMVRDIVGPVFREVYVDASLEACEERDPKGLYKRARAGQIPQFTGISSPYEPPEKPDLRIDTVAYSVESAVRQLRDYLAGAGLLGARRDPARTAGLVAQRTGTPFHIQ